MGRGLKWGGTKRGEIWGGLRWGGAHVTFLGGRGGGPRELGVSHGGWGQRMAAIVGGGGTRWPPWLGEAGLPALECKDGAVGGGTSGPWERVLGWDFLC